MPISLRSFIVFSIIIAAFVFVGCNHDSSKIKDLQSSKKVKAFIADLEGEWETKCFDMTASDSQSIKSAKYIFKIEKYQNSSLDLNVVAKIWNSTSDCSETADEELVGQGLIDLLESKEDSATDLAADIAYEKGPEISKLGLVSQSTLYTRLNLNTKKTELIIATTGENGQSAKTRHKFSDNENGFDVVFKKKTK